MQGQLDTLEPKNEQEAYLIHMVKNYDPLPEYDEQMKQLFKQMNTKGGKRNFMRGMRNNRLGF